MNRRIVLMSAIALALLAGCATTTTARPLPSMDQVAAEPLPPMASGPMTGPVVPQGVPYVPPARPQPMGPPQNWGWLNTPPYGCETGPLALAISNSTEYFMALQIDGQDFMVRGGMGVLPHLPPGATMYVCLSDTAVHTITGTAYVARYGALQEVGGDMGRFTWSGSFGINYNGNIGHHQFDINNNLLYFN